MNRTSVRYFGRIGSVLLLAAGLIACTKVGGPSAIVSSLPTTAAYPSQPSTMRPALLIQYCSDDTGSYPHAYFRQANALMATSLKDAVTANQLGVTLFATAITHDTFNARNTLDPAFTIYAIPGFQPTPTLVPTLPPNNPVFDPSTATAVNMRNVQGIVAYNHGVSQTIATLQQQQAAIDHDVTRLTNWNPLVDVTATSVLGCFQLAAVRFHGQSAVKMIYIASDLENNTDVDYTQSFVTSRRLSGAIVHVIFFFSASAARNHQKVTNWCNYLKAAGANQVLFSDPAVPLPNLFNTDLAAPVESC